MEFEIIDESGNGRFILLVSGSYSVDDNILMIKRLAMHSNWKKGMDVLLDHRKTLFDDAEIDFVSQISIVTAVFEKEYGARRCAIVGPIEGFSKIAMYKFDIDSKVKMHTKLFPPDEYDDAVKWIEST